MSKSGRCFTAGGTIGVARPVTEDIDGRGSNALGRIVRSEREDCGRLLAPSREKAYRKWGFATSYAVSLIDQKTQSVISMRGGLEWKTTYPRELRRFLTDPDGSHSRKANNTSMDSPCSAAT